MIRIINGANANKYPETLDQVFRLRHQIFVEELGWKQFEVDGIYEKDKYDDEHAIHIVSIRNGELVVGYCRLYPTTLPHMLSEVFPMYVDGTVPQRSDIFELTRGAVARDFRGGNTHAEVFTGAHEYCQMHGASAITSFVRAFRLPYFQAEGMKITPLGIPADCSGEMLAAVLLEVNDSVIREMWKRGGFTGSVLENDFEQRKIA